MEKKVAQEPSRREVKKVIAATNNHYKGQAAVNAIDLKRLLGVKENPIPDELLKEYPQLKGADAEPWMFSAVQRTRRTQPASRSIDREKPVPPRKRRPSRARDSASL